MSSRALAHRRGPPREGAAVLEPPAKVYTVLGDDRAGCKTVDCFEDENAALEFAHRFLEGWELYVYVRREPIVFWLMRRLRSRDLPTSVPHILLWIANRIAAGDLSAGGAGYHAADEERHTKRGAKK